MAESGHKPLLVPLWNPIWLKRDPVRRDVLAGAVVASVIAIALSSVDRLLGLVLLALVFATCFAISIARGLLSVTRHEHAGLIWFAIIVGTPVVLALCMAFPIFAAVLAISLFIFRLIMLSLRGDLDVLIIGSIAWLAVLLVAYASATPIVTVPVAAFVGALLVTITLHRGYRAMRLPYGLIEAPAMIFGLVLGLMSVTRAIHSLSPGPARQVVLGSNVDPQSHLPNISSPTRVHYISGYQRTVADSNPFNNLSTPPGTRTGLGELKYVRGHYRSVADGIDSNNLAAHSHLPSPPSVRQIPITLVSGGPEGTITHFPLGVGMTLAMASSPDVVGEIRERMIPESGLWWRFAGWFAYLEE